MLRLRHHGGGDKRCDARLANRDDVSAGADRLEKVDEVLDIVVETELAIRERYVARVVPVRDVDIMISQHGVRGGTQQRREMPGQRRHQQHARLRGGDILLEMQERSERRSVDRLLAHRNLTIADYHGVDAERRSVMSELGAGNQLTGSGKIAHNAEIFGERRTYWPCSQRRQGSYRDHEVGVSLIGLVEHLCRLDGGRAASPSVPLPERRLN